MAKASDVVPTPMGVFQALDRAYGPFTLDAAALPENAKCARYWTPQDDALTQDWKGVVWCNPPYSEPGKWTAKAAEEYASGNAERIVMFVPARVGARWFRAAVDSGANVVVWPRRPVWDRGTLNIDSAALTWGCVTKKALICYNCNEIFVARGKSKTCSSRCRVALFREAA